MHWTQTASSWFARAHVPLFTGIFRHVRSPPTSSSCYCFRLSLLYMVLMMKPSCRAFLDGFAFMKTLHSPGSRTRTNMRSSVTRQTGDACACASPASSQGAHNVLSSGISNMLPASYKKFTCTSMWRALDTPATMSRGSSPYTCASAPKVFFRSYKEPQF